MDQKQKSERTQQLIVEKAFELFYENGCNATSVGVIMDSAGLTKGAFYHHFSSKQELILSVLSNIVKNRIYKGMIAPLYQEGNELDILKRTFSSKIMSFSDFEKSAGCALNNLINEIGGSEPAYQSALRSIIEEWKAALVALLDRGKNSGVIRDSCNSGAVAVFLISAFEGVRGIRKIYRNDGMFNSYLTGLSEFIEGIGV